MLNAKICGTTIDNKLLIETYLQFQ